MIQQANRWSRSHNLHSSRWNQLHLNVIMTNLFHKEVQAKHGCINPTTKSIVLESKSRQKVPLKSPINIHLFQFSKFYNFKEKPWSMFLASFSKHTHHTHSYNQAHTHTTDMHEWRLPYSLMQLKSWPNLETKKQGNHLSGCNIDFILCYLLSEVRKVTSSKQSSNYNVIECSQVQEM